MFKEGSYDLAEYSKGVAKYATTKLQSVATNSYLVQINNLDETLKVLSANFQKQNTKIQQHSVSKEMQHFLDDVDALIVPTHGPNVYRQFGGSSAGKRLFRLYADGKKNYKDPILVIGTDGIGSKILIAKLINKYETIGIDLVAMCVNDILCNGAAPLTFLDYYACGKIDGNISKSILSGVVGVVRL